MHMAQLMPLPLTVSCFRKIQSGFTFLVPAHLGSPGQRALNGCVCVCVLLVTIQANATQVGRLLKVTHQGQHRAGGEV